MRCDMPVCTCRSFEALRKEFAQEGSVQLQKFLCADRSQSLSAALAARDNADFGADKWPAMRPKPKYTDGLSGGLTAEGEEGAIDGWSVVGPAHMQRYLRFGLSGDVDPASGSDQKSVARQERPCAAGKELATIKDDRAEACGYDSRSSAIPTWVGLHCSTPWSAREGSPAGRHALVCCWRRRWRHE